MPARRLQPSFLIAPVLACAAALAAGLHGAGDGTAPAPGAPPVPVPAAAPAAAPAWTDASLAGLWRTVPAEDLSTFLLVAFERSGEHWTMSLSVPAAMVVDQPCQEVEVGKDGQFAGQTDLMGATLRLSGAPTADGSHLDAQLEVTRAGGEPRSTKLQLERTIRVESIPGARRYTAELDAMGVKLPMAIHLADRGAEGIVGSIDIPVQGVKDMPLVVAREGTTIVARIPVGVPAIMRLQPKDDGMRLEGTFSQGRVDAPVVFMQTDAAVKGSARPQEPKPPFPYTAREVSVPTPKGHVLAGTLTLPEGASSERRAPGAVLLTGSGLQDRDETLLGHKPFLVIADALTRAGVAVLRCDDRGIGGSSGNGASATIEDFAEDGRAIMAFLRTQPEVDPARCGYIGHSEGGITGPLAARQDQEAREPVAFVVLLAGPGVSGAEVLPLQMRRILLATGVPEQRVEQIVVGQRRMLEAALAGATADELAPMAAELLALQQRTAAEQSGTEPPAAPALDSPEVKGVVAQIQGPWFLSFLRLDPAPTLKALQSPVLAMNGDRDTQVDSEQNLLRIEALRREAGLPVTVKRYPSLNHLFQPATTGGVDEYAMIETTFDPTALEDLVEWVAATTGITPAVEGAAGAGTGPGSR